MAQLRLDLQALLKEITTHVYFQPPNNVQMQYPCIVYARNGDDSKWAGNQRYAQLKRYQVTVIDRDPDSTLPDQVESLPFSNFDRSFKADDLNHSVFNLFF